jgi:hypothetical protein
LLEKGFEIHPPTQTVLQKVFFFFLSGYSQKVISHSQREKKIKDIIKAMIKN